MTGTVDQALDLLAGLVLEDGRCWGDAAVPDQWADARAVLDADGPPYHFLTRARGYSKTSDLAGIAIAAMLAQLPAGSRLYGLAADRDQGRLLVDSIAGFKARTPALGAALQVDQYKAVAANGSVLEVLAADVAGAYGLRPAFLIVDEIAQWASTAGTRGLWEATTSAMAKVAGSRLVVLTSAGEPAHWSHQVIRHAMDDPLWRVHEIDGPPPWADPVRLEEQRRRLPESSFARLFLNRWTAAEDRLTSIDDLRACVTLEGPLPPQSGRQYVIGLDVGLKNDRTVAAVCHGEPVEREDERGHSLLVGTRVVLDRMLVWQGSRQRPVRLDEVEAAVLQAVRVYGARVVADPWQAAQLLDRLRQRGVVAEEYSFNAASVSRLAVTLHTQIRAHLLALPDDRDLVDELANVRLRETSTPGQLRMDHDASRHDDRAIALALAAEWLVSRPEYDWADVYSLDGDADSGSVDPADPWAATYVADPPGSPPSAVGQESAGLETIRRLGR